MQSRFRARRNNNNNNGYENVQQQHNENEMAEDDFNVDDLREDLARMKFLLAQNVQKLDQAKQGRRPCGTSLIDGNFLSNVFIFIFIIIIGVSFYAFRNLYIAVLKKFPSQPRDEL